jgi:hypothetical protein
MCLPASSHGCNPGNENKTRRLPTPCFVEQYSQPIFNRYIDFFAQQAMKRFDVTISELDIYFPNRHNIQNSYTRFPMYLTANTFWNIFIIPATEIEYFAHWGISPPARTGTSRLNSGFAITAPARRRTVVQASRPEYGENEIGMMATTNQLP